MKSGDAACSLTTREDTREPVWLRDEMLCSYRGEQVGLSPRKYLVEYNTPVNVSGVADHQTR